ncbi:MAG: DUF5677 domain-containing protein [Dehalococcoidia bacterium]
MTLIGLPAQTDWPVPQLFDRRRLELAQSNAPFQEAALGFSTEFGELTALLAPVRSLDASSALEVRNAAILRAITVRVVKLTRAFIASTMAGQGELQALYDRLLFETIVDMGYLLRGGPDRYDAFTRYELRHDRELLDHLGRNRALRSGNELPMEQRTRERIEAKLSTAGLSADTVPLPGEPSGWPPFEERLGAIGEVDARAMHQLGAGSTHGLWHEIVTYHLEGDGLDARLAWSRPLTQPLFALPIQGGRIMATYATHLGPEAKAAFRDRYLDLVRRANGADLLHEDFMARSDVGPPPEV